MGDQEDSSARRKEFQKRTDEDIDSFLARKEFSKPSTASTSSSQPSTTSTAAYEKPEAAPKQVPKPVEIKETTEEEHEAQLKAARTSRAEHEAYHDVAVLRKKAHA